MENSENLVLSRSVCYALLGALAIALLILANGAPGGHIWFSSQLEQGSFGSQGFHFSQLLVSVRVSAELLRERLHNTWLFLYVFLGVWGIVLTWGLLERRRLKLRVGRREVYWMGWMSLSVISTAMLYGIGTNGLLARRYPRAVPVSDALAIGFVLALPVFAWNRLQRRRDEDEDGEEVGPRRAYSTLRLNEDDGYLRPRPRFQDRLMQPAQEGFALQSFQTTADAGTIAGTDRLIETAQFPTATQLEPLREPPSAPSPSTAPFELAASTAPAASAAPVLSSPENFREHLRTLNESWARIERTGKEIEHWFDQQRLEVISRLERHPGVRGTTAPAPPSTEFLNEKLAAVDAEWAAIRRAALEISRWFGDAPAANS